MKSDWKLWDVDVAYLLLLSLQVHQSQQKAWKVRAQTALASLSCVPRAAFIWKMSTSIPDSDPAFSIPSIRTDLFVTKIIQSLYSFYLIFCFSDQSQWRPLKEVHRDKGGLFIPLSLKLEKKIDSCKDVLDTLLYDWCLKNHILFSQLWKHFINYQMVFSCVSWPELWSSNMDSRDILLPVMVVLSTLILN